MNFILTNLYKKMNNDDPTMDYNSVIRVSPSTLNKALVKIHQQKQPRQCIGKRCKGQKTYEYTEFNYRILVCDLCYLTG